MQFTVALAIQKGSEILRLNSFDIDTFIMQFSNEIKNTVTYSVNRHPQLICIVVSAFDSFLMDILIK